MTTGQRRAYQPGTLALVLSVSVLASWWAFVHRSNAAISTQPTSRTGPVPQPKSVFYRQELVPLLDKAKKNNHEAADRAIERLKKDFDRYRSGIPAYVGDVASWGTRFGLLGRTTKDG